MSAQTIALLFLGAVALTLLFAAGYAVFGRPRSAKSKKRQKQVINGFGLAGGILLGAFLVACLVFGIGTAFFGVEGGRIPSKTAAFAIAVGSFLLIALLVQRWEKYFAGWMAWSVFNALASASSGHAINNPNVHVSRSASLIVAVVMLITVGASVRLKQGYKLTTVDRTALLLWVLAFAIGANSEKYMLAYVIVGCAAMVLAAAYHHYQKRSQFIEHKTVVGGSV